MEITYDPEKSARNLRERDLSFERAVDFDFESAVITIDERHDYGEERIIATGYLDRRLHLLCFVETPTGIRVISFRKANSREVKNHEKTRPVDR